MSPDLDVNMSVEAMTSSTRAAPGPHAPSAATSSADLRRAADRLDICATCPEFRGANVLTIRCHNCGCGALSLRTGVCKLGKWSTP